MANNQIVWNGTTALTRNVRIEARDGTVWNGTAFVSFAVADIASYVLAMAESPADSGRYALTFPAGIAAGEYREIITDQALAAATTFDVVLRERVLTWNGTSLAVVSDVLTIKGVDADTAIAARVDASATGVRALLALPAVAPDATDGLPTTTEIAAAFTEIKGATWAAGTDTLEKIRDGVALADSEDIYHADVFLTRDTLNTRDEYTVVWYKNGSPITSGITSPTINVVKRSDGTDIIATTAMTAPAAGFFTYNSTTRLTSGEAAIANLSATIDGAARSWSRPVGRDI